MMQSSADYFVCFGLPERYMLDMAVLKAAYFKMARQSHPDTQAQVLDIQHQAAQRMAFIHAAYETLADSFLRARYLAKLRAVTPSTTVPPDVLAEQFALREAIDDAETADEKKQLKDALFQQMRVLETQCGQAFDVTHDRTVIERCLHVWPYYQRALAQLSEYEG